MVVARVDSVDPGVGAEASVDPEAASEGVWAVGEEGLVGLGAVSGPVVSWGCESDPPARQASSHPPRPENACSRDRSPWPLRANRIESPIQV